MKRWFFILKGISNTSTHYIDHKIPDASVSCMFDVFMIFALLRHRVDDAAFSEQKHFINVFNKSILHSAHSADYEDILKYSLYRHIFCHLTLVSYVQQDPDHQCCWFFWVFQALEKKLLFFKSLNPIHVINIFNLSKKMATRSFVKRHNGISQLPILHYVYIFIS